MKLQHLFFVAALAVAVEAQEAARVKTHEDVVEFVETREGERVEYKNWRDISSLVFEWGNGRFQADAYDENNDGKLDAVTLRNLNELTHFYRGRAHSDRMVKTYGVHCTPSRKIAEREVGMVVYNNPNGPPVFTPDSSAQPIFDILDRIYVETRRSAALSRDGKAAGVCAVSLPYLRKLEALQ